jgi:Ni/Fe-hydrogenase subunit HybB-like protein
MTAHAGRVQMSAWRWTLLLLTTGGAIASFRGAVYGIGSTTSLSDVIPWGLCLGLNVFCGIALAAGALTVAAAVFVSDRADYRAVARASLVTGAVGYLVAMLGVVANQGLCERAWWTVLSGWTPRSILSGAVWTLLLLAGVLLIEFLPDWSRSAARSRWFAVLQRLDVSLVILAAALAIRHQYGLNRVIGLAGPRVSPLWAGSTLPLMFYLSSISGALAVLLFASWRCRLAFGKTIPTPILRGVARALTISVFLYLLLRLSDLIEIGVLPVLLQFSREHALLLLEIALFFCGMMSIKEHEADPSNAFLGPALIMAGVLANRVNTSITAVESAAGQQYWPSWGEVLIAYSLVALGIAAFALGVKHLEIFPIADYPDKPAD